MAHLDSPLTLRGLRIKNRLCRSATWEGMAENGQATDALVELMETLAREQIGLIVSGMVKLSADDPSSPTTLDASGPHCLESLKRLAEAQRRHGAVPAIQLAHQGAAARSEEEGFVPAGPSAVRDDRLFINCRELSTAEIQRLVEDFARAARLAVEAGFQVLQLHGAHGYLLSQFLSPVYNRRSDRYGGSALNRGRIIFEILEAARAAVGDEAVFSIKINGSDYLEGGLTVDDSRAVAVELAAQGLDMVEVSGGLPQSGPLGPIRPAPKSREEEAPFAAVSAYYKEKLKIPVYVVANIRSLSVAQSLLAENKADGVALSRPLIREPELGRLWLSGRDPRDAACVSCNACARAAFKGLDMLRCQVVNKN